MPARIVFAGGGEVTVAEDAAAVQLALSEDRSRGELFTKLGAHGAELELYVAGDQVAYVQQIPSRAQS